MSEPIKWSNAPDRTSWGASMRVADIALDRDHTLTLFCEADQTAKVDAMFAEVERLRETAEQALEALEQIKCFMFHPAKVFQWNPTIIALRAALKERNT